MAGAQEANCKPFREPLRETAEDAVGIRQSFTEDEEGDARQMMSSQSGLHSLNGQNVPCRVGAENGRVGIRGGYYALKMRKEERAKLFQDAEAKNRFVGDSGVCCERTQGSHHRHLREGVI